METYDWGSVEARAAQTAQIWQQGGGIIAPPARRYSFEEQLVNEGTGGSLAGHGYDVIETGCAAKIPNAHPDGYEFEFSSGEARPSVAAKRLR